MGNLYLFLISLICWTFQSCSSLQQSYDPASHRSVASEEEPVSKNCLTVILIPKNFGPYAGEFLNLVESKNYDILALVTENHNYTPLTDESALTGAFYKKMFDDKEILKKLSLSFSEVKFFLHPHSLSWGSGDSADANYVSWGIDLVSFDSQERTLASVKKTEKKVLGLKGVVDQSAILQAMEEIPSCK